MNLPTALKVIVTNMKTTLSEHGIDYMPIPLNIADQLQASLRTDLVYEGIDPANEDAFIGAFGGLLVGLKILAQTGAPPVVVVQYTMLVEAFMAGAERSDQVLPSADFEQLIASLSFQPFGGAKPEEPESDRPEDSETGEVPMCSKGCGNTADMLYDGQYVCAKCVVQALSGAVGAPSAGSALGGPDFQRPGDEQPSPPSPPAPRNLLEFLIHWLKGQ